MAAIFRKNQKVTMAIFAIVSCFALIGFFNGPSSCSRSDMPHVSEDIAKMYGNTVTRTALQREANKGQLAQMLGLDLFTELSGRASSLENFAWNSLVVQHEADRLQIEPLGSIARPDDEAVLNAIKNISMFQTFYGQFDPRKYKDFIGENKDYDGQTLTSLGFSEDDLFNLIEEDLRVKKIKELLGANFVIPTSDYRAAYAEQYQKMDTSVIHFKLADFAAKVQVSETDITKTFTQHLEGYHSKEKRGIEFVTFALSDADQKLEDKARVAALQKLTQSVEDFTQALQEKGADFDKVAAKLKVPVTVVPPFAGTEPDPKIPKSPAFLNTVFSLTPENPVSEPVSDRETATYYVIKLGEVIPSKILNLAEARQQVIDEIKNSRAKETVDLQSRDVRNKILADMTTGKSFADAAKAAGQTVEAYPPFSYMEKDELIKKPDARQVFGAAFNMKEGELSQAMETLDGAILVHLDKREPIDEKKYEADRAQYEPGFDDQQVGLVFSEWLRQQHDDAKIQLLVTRDSATPPK